MSLREKLEANQNVLFGVCAVVILGVMGFTAYPYVAPMIRQGPHRATSAYYYDIASNELTTAPIDSVPPMLKPGETTGTPNLVRAYVFSCGDCADQSTHFIGYLFKVSTEYKAKFDAAPDDVKRKFFAPLPMDVSGVALPKMDIKPATTEPTDMSPANWIRISEVIPTKDVKAQWKIPKSPNESSALAKRIAKHCTTTLLRSCDPK